jgi:hypothetical protein
VTHLAMRAKSLTAAAVRRTACRRGEARQRSPTGDAAAR